MEIIIPMLVVAMVAGIRTAVPIQDKPDELNLQIGFNYYFSQSWATQLTEMEQKVAWVANRVQDRDTLARMRDAFGSAHAAYLPSAWSTTFDTETDLVNYIQSDAYPDSRGRIDSAVVLHEWDVTNGVFDYSIRMNSSAEQDAVPRIKPGTDDFTIGVTMRNANTYTAGGFFDLQVFVDQFALNDTLVAGNASSSVFAGRTQSVYNNATGTYVPVQQAARFDDPLFMFHPMPTPKHYDDLFASILGGLVGFLYCLA